MRIAELAEIQSILELKAPATEPATTPATSLPATSTTSTPISTQLQEARDRIIELQALAETLDPTGCTDPHRCQVIDAQHGQ